MSELDAPRRKPRKKKRRPPAQRVEGARPKKRKKRRKPVAAVGSHAERKASSRLSKPKLEEPLAAPPEAPSRKRGIAIAAAVALLVVVGDIILIASSGDEGPSTKRDTKAIATRTASPAVRQKRAPAKRVAAPARTSGEDVTPAPSRDPEPRPVAPPPGPRVDPAPQPAAPEPAPLPDADDDDPSRDAPPPRVYGEEKKAPAAKPVEPAPRPVAKPKPVAKKVAKPANTIALAKIEKQVLKRVRGWFKLRAPKKLRCQDCEGKLKVRCKPCKGRLRVACRRCGGAGSIVTIIPSRRGRRWITSRGGKRVRKTCPTCRGGRTLDCPRCTDGTQKCKCTQKDRGALAGYRPLAGKRAFWAYLSPTARKGHTWKRYYINVARNNALQKQRGKTLVVIAVDGLQVKVKRDHVIVTARVEWDLSDAAIERQTEQDRTYVTTWIRERGQFYLATRTVPRGEVLLE